MMGEGSPPFSSVPRTHVGKLTRVSLFFQTKYCLVILLFSSPKEELFPTPRDDKHTPREELLIWRHSRQGINKVLVQRAR